MIVTRLVYVVMGCFGDREHPLVVYSTEVDAMAFQLACIAYDLTKPKISSADATVAEKYNDWRNLHLTWDIEHPGGYGMFDSYMILKIPLDVVIPSNK